MAYAAKNASAFYGPFREAADSAPAFGDRRGYQMDPANGREALREMALDVAEGADMLLVKPALPAARPVAAARARFDLPIAAYQVSGEYAMLAAAAERGWIDGRAAMTESRRRRSSGPAPASSSPTPPPTSPRWLRERAMTRRAEHVYIQALALGIDPRLAPPADRRSGMTMAARLSRPTAAADSAGVRSVQLLIDRARAGRRPPAVADGAHGRRARDGGGRASCAPASGGGSPFDTRCSAASARPSTCAGRPSRSSRCSAASDPATWSSTRSRRAPSGTCCPSEARQGVMNEHMRVGRDYPTSARCWPTRSGSTTRTSWSPTRPTTWPRSATWSGSCASTESRRSTVNDTPILLGVHRPLERDHDPAGRSLTVSTRARDWRHRPAERFLPRLPARTGRRHARVVHAPGRPLPGRLPQPARAVPDPDAGQDARAVHARSR